MTGIFHAIIYLLFMLAFGFALFGWGNLIGSSALYSVRIVLGMAVALFVGGLANFLGLAYGITLNLFLVAGICLGFRELFVHNALSAFRNSLQSRRSSTIWLLPASFLAAYTILAATVMIPEAYNFHDDLQKYFIHPVKMLATGSMYGSPLTTLGKEVLGGQALFQAFFVYNLGVEAINAFDSTFCLLLSCLLLVEYGVQKHQMSLGLLAALLLFLIHPQYVNISSLYSFVVFVIATLLIADEMAKTRENVARLNHLVLLLGVMYSGIVVLKTTYALFPLVHFPLFLLSLMILRVPVATLLRIATIATGSSLLVAGVWFVEPAVLFINYGLLGDSSTAVPFSLGQQNFSLLLSTSPLFYGGTALQYSSLVLMSVAGAALLFTGRAAFSKGIRVPEFSVASSATVTLVLLYCYLTLVVGSETHSFGTSLRYSIPFIISIVPTVALLTLCLLREKGDKHAFFALLGLTLLILLLQPAATLKGWQQSINCGSSLSFSKTACGERYQEYNKVALGDFGAQQVRSWQAKIPPGEAIVAWINYAHHFDFARNPILEVDPAGISNPWAHFPESNYFMIDSGGYATRSRDWLAIMVQNDYLYDRNIWIKSLQFMDYLEQFIPLEAVLYKDQQVGVFKIARPERQFNNGGER